LGHVIDTSLNFFRWISSVERERESEVRQAKKRIRLEMRRRAGAGDLTDEGDADEKSPEMRVPVAEALRLWPGKASLERLQNLGASVPEALRGIASDTDGKKEMRGLAASALLFLEGFPAATSLFPSFFDLYVSGVADPLPLRRVEAEAEMFRLGYQLMHNELRGWNRFAHAAMIRVLGEASLQALRILKRRASRSGNEARMIRLMLATVSKEG
jgi:hypothetical protein